MKILIVEDDPDDLEQVRSACSDSDVISTAATLRDAKAALAESWPELIILDAIFPSISFPSHPDLHKGFNADNFLEVVAQLITPKKRPPDTILISGEVEAAEHFQKIARRLNTGSLYDVIPKGGFSSNAFFLRVLAHKIDGLRRDRPYAAVVSNAKSIFAQMEEHGIVSRDPVMLRLWDRIKEHAEPPNHKSTCYVWGEPGVGKELVAQAIAKLKDARVKPINMNRNDEVVLSEFFGSRAGAFTGSQDRMGWIGEIGKGVLFLDQFCSISEKLQSALLRLFERDARDFAQVGGETRTAECKFVIADTLSPDAAVNAKSGDPKRMIPEMYSRLRFGAIEVPPLRARRGDIPELVRWFLKRENDARRKRVAFTADVMDRFAAGQWPGNVRALRDIVTGLVTSFWGVVGWDEVSRWQDYPLIFAELGDGETSGADSEPGAAGDSEDEEANLLLRLRDAVAPHALPLISLLEEMLKKRSGNNPARRLVYRALLVVAENRPHSAGRARLEQHLPVAETQTNTLCKELGGLLQGELSKLGACSKVEGKYILTMPVDILRNP
jgi:DNA-binding NtrC family response regulator